MISSFSNINTALGGPVRSASGVSRGSGPLTAQEPPGARAVEQAVEISGAEVNLPRREDVHRLNQARVPPSEAAPNDPGNIPAESADQLVQNMAAAPAGLVVLKRLDRELGALLDVFG